MTLLHILQDSYLSLEVLLLYSNVDYETSPSEPHSHSLKGEHICLRVEDSLMCLIEKKKRKTFYGSAVIIYSGKVKKYRKQKNNSLMIFFFHPTLINGGKK